MQSSPIRPTLVRLEKLPLGRALLNKLSRLTLHRGVYENFAEAWRVARRVRTAGHEHPENIETHLDLAKTLRASDYAVLYWLSVLDQEYKGTLRILDFGGNAGNLYFSYSSYLSQLASDISWTVVDLPGVIEQGLRIANARGAKSLFFAKSVSEVPSPDVLLVSGALHYWEGSICAFLDQFSSLPMHVIVNRTPVHTTESSFVTIQVQRSYAVPCIVRNEGQVISEFESRDYFMVDRWHSVELRLRIPLFPRVTVPHYSGFYFRRRHVEAPG